MRTISAVSLPPRAARIAYGLLVATLLVCGVMSSTARAVVVASPNSNITLSAPANIPGWSNMAYLNSASAVYLGDRWVITAAHVGDGPIRLTDGRVLQPVLGSDVRLVNPASTGLSGQPDLLMFQVTTDPGLPALDIASTTPHNGATLTLMGAGRDRAANQIGWEVSSSSGANVWTQAPLPIDSVRGFSLLSTAHMRWGQSQVTGAAIYNNQDNGAFTDIFMTRFSASGGPFQAQAVPGDSGGGVFQTVAGHSALAGIIDAEAFPLGNQPANTVVFGQSTYTADLSVYRDEILSIRGAPVPLAQNQINHFDVNNSGVFSPADLLQLMDEVNQLPGHSMIVTSSPGPNGPFYDVDGNGVINGDDVQAEHDILQALGITGPAASAAELARPLVAGSSVPEPSSIILAVTGLLTLLGVHRMTLARRKKHGGA